MSNSQPKLDDSRNGDEQDGFASLLKAAEAGNASAQLRLAQHYSESNGPAGDPVTAYTWCLLSERTAGSMRSQIESSKTTISRNLSPQQVDEAEQRAAEWQKNTQKKSSFVERGDQPSGKTTADVS